MAERASKELSGDLPAEKRGAIVIENRIAEDILHEHSDVLAVLIRRRLRRETLEEIARKERKILERLGARTDAVRKVVIYTVCAQALSSKVNGEIKHAIRKRHALAQQNFTDDRRRKSAETRRVHDWTPEKDQKLIDLMGSYLHSGDGSPAGHCDWQRITSEMNRRFHVQVSQNLWRRRGQYLRKNAKENQS